jgi:hypothetical protein
MKLPQRAKKRLYVVHTLTIPDEFDLRVAPTGTEGTLRLDQFQRGGTPGTVIATSGFGWNVAREKERTTRDAYSISLEDDEILPLPWSSASNEYSAINEDAASKKGLSMNSSFANMALPRCLRFQL